MVALRLGEPLQRLLLGPVVAFAHGLSAPFLECSIIASSRALAQVYSYPKGDGQRALRVNFALTEFSEVHARLWGSGCRRTFEVRPYLRARTKEQRERVLSPLVAAFGVLGGQRPCGLSPARA